MRGQQAQVHATLMECFAGYEASCKKGKHDLKELQSMVLVLRALITHLHDAIADGWQTRSLRTGRPLPLFPSSSSVPPVLSSYSSAPPPFFVRRGGVVAVVPLNALSSECDREAPLQGKQTRGASYPPYTYQYLARRARGWWWWLLVARGGSWLVARGWWLVARGRVVRL
jgi:hypothetical protein